MSNISKATNVNIHSKGDTSLTPEWKTLLASDEQRFWVELESLKDSVRAPSLGEIATATEIAIPRMMRIIERLTALGLMHVGKSGLSDAESYSTAAERAALQSDLDGSGGRDTMRQRPRREVADRRGSPGSITQ